MSGRRAALLLLALLLAGGCAKSTARPVIDTPPALPPAAVAVEAPRPAPAGAEQAQVAEQLVRLAGEVSELQNAVARLVAMTRQQEDQIRSLERRLGEVTEQRSGGSSLPKGFAPSQVSPAPAPGVSSKIDRAEDLYEAAAAKLKAGELDAAVLTFYDLIANHPDHPLRENAQFMVGDIFYRQKDLRGALAEFESLLATRPDGQRASETLLRIGLCHRGLGDEASARRTWERLTRTHPDSAAAREARLLLRGARGG